MSICIIRISALVALSSLLFPNFSYADRTLQTDVSWVSGSSRTDLDLYVVSPKGDVCDYSTCSENWGVRHERDDQGSRNEYSYESFTVNLDEMDCYAEGDYKFYIRHYSGPSVLATFSTSGGQEWSFRVNPGDDKYAVRYNASKNSCTSESLSLTKIPNAMREKEWHFAASLMERWFRNKSGDILDLNIEDINNTYPDARAKYNDIVNKIKDNNLFTNENIRDHLLPALRDVDGRDVYEYGGEFDFTETEFSLRRDGWISAGAEAIYMNWIYDKKVGEWWANINQNDGTAAFSKAVWRAVAGGSVIRSGTNIRVTINKVGIYFRDSYDFDGEQPLGCWSEKPPYFSPHSIVELESPYKCASNADFRAYNRANGQNENYGDYRIFSVMKTLSTNQIFNFSNSLSLQAGSTCDAGKVYDCESKCISAYTAQIWTNDGYCDDGRYGMNLMCSAFDNDGNDCGL